jgi:hypothetical protein
MAHHGDDIDTLRKFLGLPDGLGATGRFPLGQLNPDDEGEIQVAVAADPKHQKVVIDFGKPVAWIGFTPDQARELGEMLIAKAMECRGIK